MQIFFNYLLGLIVFPFLLGVCVRWIYLNHKKKMAAKRRDLKNRIVINGEILPRKDTIYD